MKLLVIFIATTLFSSLSVKADDSKYFSEKLSFELSRSHLLDLNDCTRLNDAEMMNQRCQKYIDEAYSLGATNEDIFRLFILNRENLKDEDRKNLGPLSFDEVRKMLNRIYQD